jgi:cellulose synthase/poly-beta-1,6-N-acetylglucosamine synthase-like glycosyltransferase
MKPISMKKSKKKSSSTKSTKCNNKSRKVIRGSSEYVVCIPSYKRAKICNEKTLKMLQKERIPASKIYIYVASSEEKKEYEAVLDKSLYGHLIVGKPGVVAQRHFITQQWGEGKHLVLLDDDVESVDMSLSDMFRGKSLDAFFRAAFTECEKKGSYMWGVYPVLNPFFRKGRPEISYGLTYIIAAFHGIINRPRLKSIVLKTSQEIPYKEDVERTILYFKTDGILVRFNRIGFKTKYYGTEGGLGTFESRIQPSKKASYLLQKEYSEFGKVVERPNGMTEFKLNRLPPDECKMVADSK